MKTKETFSECCKGLGGKNKKGLVLGIAVAMIFLALSMSIANLSWENRALRRMASFCQSDSARMMRDRGKNVYAAPVDQKNDGQKNFFESGAQSSRQDPTNKLIFVLILKTAILVVLLVALVKIGGRIFKSAKANKKHKTIPVRQVKLQVKTRPRAVKRATKRNRL